MCLCTDMHFLPQSVLAAMIAGAAHGVPSRRTACPRCLVYLALQSLLPHGPLAQFSTTNYSFFFLAPGHWILKFGGWRRKR